MSSKLVSVKIENRFHHFVCCDDIFNTRSHLTYLSQITCIKNCEETDSLRKACLLYFFT
jgi:hypothetical protein